MINVFSPLVQAWLDLLLGNITIDSVEVGVYPFEAPSSDTKHKVIIRSESSNQEGNKHAWIINPVIIVEIIGVFDTIIDYRVVDSIDNQINALVFNTPSSRNLSVSGFTIVGVDAGSPTYLPEDDGTQKLLRKITRFTHQTIQ